MNDFFNQLLLGSPLFTLILIGYLLRRFASWPQTMSQHLTTFVFSVGLPAMLFRMMSDLSHLPPVDKRLLMAFFGACFLVFVLGRLLAWKAFRLDGVGQSIFAISCIFSNNVMLGLPLAKASLGEQAIPAVALILIFNALILWSVISVSVAFYQHGNLSLTGVKHTVAAVFKNPIILSILLGTGFGLTGFSIPSVIDTPLSMLGQTGMPLALVTMGMSLADYDISSEWTTSITIALLKVLLLPAIVLGICHLIDLPTLETRVAVLLSSIGLGANVFLMARQFQAIEGGVAGALILSTIGSAISTPLFLAIASAF